MQNVDKDVDRIRQAERTVDNLKRLYAVLFALSFAVLAQGVARKMTSVLGGDPWTLPELLAHAEVTVIFALTAGLFYYQSDRFLDVALARRPLPDVSAWRFAGGYLVNVVTMAPFYLMAFALSSEQSRGPLGFNWYILAYIVLIVNGLVWLFLRALTGAGDPQTASAAGPDTGQDADPDADAKTNGEINALNTFWLAWNSLMLLVVVGVFYGFTRMGGLCVAGQADTLGLSLISFIGAAILVRDAVDYWHGWPIFYPVKDTEGELKRRLVLAQLSGRPAVRGWVTVGAAVLTGGSLWLLASTGVFEPGALSAACAG